MVACYDNLCIAVSGKIKSQIVDALLNIANDSPYKQCFAKYGVERFERTDSTMYDRLREVLDPTKDLTLYPTYY